jgi:hypothetical protein
MYNITEYTKNRAKIIGVTVKPSTRKNKKIDVYYKGKKIASVGDKRYKDFPTYIKEKGMEFANKKKYLYYKRHANEPVFDDDGNITNSFFAKFLLW